MNRCELTGLTSFIGLFRRDHEFSNALHKDGWTAFFQRQKPVFHSRRSSVKSYLVDKKSCTSAHMFLLCPLPLSSCSRAALTVSVSCRETPATHRWETNGCEGGIMNVKRSFSYSQLGLWWALWIFGILHVWPSSLSGTLSSILQVTRFILCYAQSGVISPKSGYNKPSNSEVKNMSQ